MEIWWRNDHRVRKVQVLDLFLFGLDFHLTIAKYQLLVLHTLKKGSLSRARSSASRFSCHGRGIALDTGRMPYLLNFCLLLRSMLFTV